LTHLRHDIGDRIAARVLALVAAEPPWRDPEVPPGCLDEIGALLSRAAPAVVNGPEFVFRLPNGLGFPHGATLVKSDTPEGEALLERLARGGMPQALLDAGFLSLGDFWWPWCVATDGDDIAAMAFTPRLCEASAEIGVYTFPAFRGRGLAAAVTAGWSSLPALAGRSLVYSTHVPNRSSQRVAARLGLHQLGGRIRIA
jgi:hypothetical protein